MKMYEELAEHWPLVSAPEEYAGEAAELAALLAGAADRPPVTVLELGSGGGNLASHLCSRYQMTLSDVSPRMLAHSRALNPDCTHVEGDMRTLRLGRTFDGVLVHDAVMYMTTEEDLRAAMMTAFVHCRPGGAAIFAPDYVAETFAPTTDTGGEDGPSTSIRWLEWRFDPDRNDTTFETHYAFLVRPSGKPVEAAHDLHVEGLFPRATWLRLLTEVGFSAHTASDSFRKDVMVAQRPT